ncbi:membrane fusion protein [Bacillus sp. OxB-1]|uniref:hypothetical protein n=1 Tax=Bacillus sp. (strain OxB-1) TaxID=98228 RepID=UPI0005823232|nr:hypothetical protein [Bacillus sp. OxB-1]BAQ09213.1 membrane fusion protein [Bacillus sp. OxB-1]
MGRNLYDETIATGKMKPKWFFYLIVIAIFLGSGLYATGYATYSFLVMGEWWMVLLFGSFFALFLGIALKIYRLTQNKKPTKIIAVAEEDAYTIYAINEWTEEEKVTKIHYGTMDRILIGVWTNRGFKGRKSDYVGARLIIRHPDKDGEMTYTSSVVFDEEVLTGWNERIREFDIPASITPLIISEVLPEQFDALFQTIDARPFDGSFSVKEFFEKQNQLVKWHQA